MRQSVAVNPTVFKVRAGEAWGSFGRWLVYRTPGNSVRVPLSSPETLGLPTGAGISIMRRLLKNIVYIQQISGKF